MLPWLVRGRSLAVDVVAATAWAAGTAAADGGARASAWSCAPPHGLVAGAVAAGAVALARAARGASILRACDEPLTGSSR